MAKKEAEILKQDEIKEEIKGDPVFSKKAILASDRYANRRDALGVILDDEKEYSTAEVDDLLDNFMKGQVK